MDYLNTIVTTGIHFTLGGMGSLLSLSAAKYFQPKLVNTNFKINSLFFGIGGICNVAAYVFAEALENKDPFVNPKTEQLKIIITYFSLGATSFVLTSLCLKEKIKTNPLAFITMIGVSHIATGVFCFASSYALENYFGTTESN
ncbi:MAG: hypothetical protein Q8K60_03510 [Parachlamydiaceae bacterium]|nr:hypothetical protein [Parachlamydiaceae bacterium]